MICTGRSRTIATGPDAKLGFIEPDGPVAAARVSPQRLIAAGALSTPTATRPHRWHVTVPRLGAASHVDVCTSDSPRSSTTPHRPGGRALSPTRPAIGPT